MSRDLVYLAPHPWETIAQRPQHLTRALARTHRVLVVEPIAPSIAGNIRHLVKRSGRVRWRGRLIQREENLWTYCPPPGLPLTMSSLALNLLAHAVVTARVRARLTELGFTRPLVIAGWPLAYPLARSLGQAGVIYDCMDNFPAFPMSARRRRVVVASERALVRRADAIVATSVSIAARWAARGYRPQIIQNGVPGSFLSEATPDPEILGLPRPRLLYIGMLGPWLDTALLLALANRHPEWSIVLIGPTEIDIRSFAAAPNIHILGVRPHERLPHYLAAADACLIPFTVSPLTRAVNPVKLYEYLAVGVPIISTPLPEVAIFDAVCSIADTPDAFIRAAATAIQESPDDPRRRQRRDLAAANTWADRAAAYDALFASLAEQQ